MAGLVIGYSKDDVVELLSSLDFEPPIALVIKEKQPLEYMQGAV